MENGFLAVCLLNKLIDLVMVSFFCRYLRVTLNFEGKLAKRAEKALMVFEILVILSNIFYPTTFMVSADGAYQSTVFS